MTTESSKKRRNNIASPEFPWMRKTLLYLVECLAYYCVLVNSWARVMVRTKFSV